LSPRTTRRQNELRGQGDVDHVRKVHVGLGNVKSP
jgi:hypothetical protein